MFKRLCEFSVLAMLSWPTLAAMPEEWRQSAYAYEATQAPLSIVLTDFTNAYGLGLSMSSVSGVVDVKLRAANAQEFLDRLALEHQFQWFVYSDKLYISAQSEQLSQRLKVSTDAVPDLKQALTDIGLLDKRFGWGELPDEGVVLVRGPARYIELIRSFTKEMDKPEEQQQVMIFPLRYASVADREINYRGQSMSIPGVLTILEGLLENRQNVPPPANDPNANIESLQDMGDSARTRLFNHVSERDTNRDEAKVATKVAERRRVAADVRNNAVLIYDNLDKHAVYQQMVAQLDLPSKLVEIDAIILDIDRTELSNLESRWSAQAGGVSFGSSLLTGGSSTLFIRDFGRFFADIQALEGQGMASVIARPSVLTLENQPAVIDFSRTQYITVSGERVANIQPVTAGTSLQVIPRTIPGGLHNRFHLIVDIEDGQLEQALFQQTPTVRRGTVSTQAVISENRSLVIGGFHVDQRGDQKNQVPVLGQLPLIGWLFSSTKREVSRRERLFILTPRLLGDDIEQVRDVANENPVKLERAMTSGRQSGGASVLRANISTVFAELVQGRTPNDVQMRSSGAALRELCKVDNSFVLDSKQMQWFSGTDFTVAVGVVKNVSVRPQRFNPVSCSGSQTLAVTATSALPLQPGESTQIFVALQSPAASLQSVAPARVLMLPSY